MAYLRKCLQQKVKDLDALIQEKRSALKDAPSGSLEIHAIAKGCQYYEVKYSKGGRKHRFYIRKKDQKKAVDLAQKAYNQTILKVAERQMQDIQNLLEKYDSDSLDHVYEQLSPQRKVLVTPIRKPAQEFIAEWMQTTLDCKNPYPIKDGYYSAKGEHMRSKSEVLIANALAEYDIPYKYETELYMESTSSWRYGKTIYPDFALLNRRTGRLYFWEHFGMMDDPEYLNKVLSKIELYEENGIYLGINLICTFESHDHPFNTQVMTNKIQKYLL